jgi:polysaccharide export outer membrane protein
MLVACAGLPRPPTNARAAHESLPGLARDVVASEALRAGDRIVVAIGDGLNAPLERTTWIEGNGRAHVASGQDVDVAGVTLAVAEQRIASVLRARDTQAVVDVRLDSATPANAIVLGAVVRPGDTPIVPAMRVSGLIASVGGLVQARVSADGQTLPSPSDLASARLLRAGVALPISVMRAVDGERGHDVFVHPGDVLYIPYVSTNGIAVLGQVGSATVIPHRPKLRLSEALSAAGGLTSWGDGDDVRILRGPSDKPVAYQASFNDFVDGEGRDVVLLPGDVVYVEDDPLEDIFEVVALISPIAGMASTFVLTAVILSQ